MDTIRKAMRAAARIGFDPYNSHTVMARQFRRFASFRRI